MERFLTACDPDRRLVALGAAGLLAVQALVLTTVPRPELGLVFVLLWGLVLVWLGRRVLTRRAQEPEAAPPVPPAAGRLDAADFAPAAERCLAEAGERRAALFLVVLDHRQRLCDLLGEAMVREAEAIVDNVLDDLLREADLRARLSDGRFVALLTGMTAPRAREIAERLKTAVEASLLVFEGRFLPIRTAIGGALANEATTYAPLLATAEMALERSRGRGLYLLCEGTPV